MARSADGFFLPKNAQSTPPSNARLSGVNAGRLHEEKTDYVCLGSRARKSLNHSNPVTAVTDSNNLTLVMCSYSAGSIFEFAISSSSGEIQVDSRPSLNRANLPGRTTELKELDVAENGSQHRPHYEQKLSESIKCNKHNVLIQSSTSEDGNQSVSGLPASGSKRI